MTSLGQVAVPDAATLPRSGDGMVNLQELVRTLAKVLVNQIMDAEVEELLGRGLSGSAMPCLWLDTTYVKCRRDGRVAPTAVVAARLLEEAEPDALAHLDFPASHWKRLRTNNLQERASREIRRRSRAVQAFPSTASPEGLVGAVMPGEDDAWSRSRYFSEARMAELRALGGEPPSRRRPRSRRGSGSSPSRRYGRAWSLRTGWRQHRMASRF